MVEEMRKDAGEYLEKDATKKYEYKINTNILVGILKEEFIELYFKGKKETERFYKKLLKEVTEHLIPVKPGRKFERKKMHSMNKYRSNLRRNV